MPKRRATYTHSHYQTEKFLTIEIQAAGVRAEEVTSKFSPHEITLAIDRENPAEVYSFDMIPFAEINPARWVSGLWSAHAPAGFSCLSRSRL